MRRILQKIGELVSGAVDGELVSCVVAVAPVVVDVGASVRAKTPGSVRRRSFKRTKPDVAAFTELDQLLADAPSPFVMQHAAKITGVRKRVSSLNSVLKSIQRRVDNIDRLVSAGLPNSDEIASGIPAER
ncbi:putative snapin/Pallidin/Snn1 [Helianthus debilis subsp. tardiflorus]